MPSRTLSLVILAFWLTTSGWLFYREFWPRFQQGDSLGDLIDLEDEARSGAVHWLVFKGHEQIGTARSFVLFFKHKTAYEMEVEYQFDKPLIPLVSIERMVSTQRVTPKGALRELKGKIKG